MIKIKEAVVVEGTYDKIKLSGLVDTLIITTKGFGIFKDGSTAEFIKKVSRKQGIIILTDSDRAGFIIRNYVKKIARDGIVKHAYIPDIKGKEKRKSSPSKEGFLGVEGVSDEVVIKALRDCCTVSEKADDKEITKADLYKDGLSGREDSYILRTKLTQELDLPKRLSANMFLDILNSMYTYDEYKNIINEIQRNR